MRLGVYLGALLVGCGPSFHAIYEGNARFEHCYALEENPQSNMRERADCWRDWSERYTYGQTRDRIQYATARYVALSQAPNVPTDEALMMAAPGMTPRVSTITAPAPTSPYAPPPKVLDEGPDAMTPTPRSGERNQVLGAPPDAATSPAPVATTTPLPQSGCSDECGRVYRECAVMTDAGASCDKGYAKCMRGCFK